MTKIIHLSDLHITSPHFLPSMLNGIIKKINILKPDMIIITGDLTDDGYLYEYEKVLEYIDKIECEKKLIVPGNHDARNCGYILFEEFFGDRQSYVNIDNITIVGVDSSIPDEEDGHIGRETYKYIEKSFSKHKNNFKILALHHHLIPIPMCGRERDVPSDAGDVLNLLNELKVDLVLCGHKHIPWIWKLNDMLILNAGTACTSRTKARIKQSYNLIEINEHKKADIFRIFSTDETIKKDLRKYF